MRRHFQIYQDTPEKSVARIVLDLRQARAQFFAPEMFGEPAWDMMLVLYTADKAPTLADLARWTNTPLSTASRWVDHLELENLVTREPRSLDKRAQRIWLTDNALEKLSALCSALNRLLVGEE